MYIITGYLKEDSKVVAYGVYDTDKKKAMIMAKEQVKNMVVHGLNVMGFERLEHEISDKVSVRKSKYYLWNDLPELNGKGEPEGEPKEILLGVNGYKEMRSYVTVNSIGGINVYSKEKMVEKLTKDNNILGAVLASDGRVLAYVKNTISDLWLIECGWERGMDLFWQRANTNSTEKTESKQPEQTEEVPRKHYVVGLHH